MEIKIEVGEDRFRDVLQKELEAFTKEELHEICRSALIQQMSNPDVFRDLFVYLPDRYGRSYSANDVLKDAAKTINFDETFKDLQDGIVNYIKEHHMDVLHDMAIQMFVDGIGRNLFYNDEFKDGFRHELIMMKSGN